jgi:hypothetical protein
MIPISSDNNTFRFACCCAIIILTLFSAPQSVYCEEPGYVESLIREAEHRKLAEERGWTALLHYGKTITGSYKSKIDDPKFFLSPHGRSDAQAELEATVRSFFQEEITDGGSSICRFPARYNWLVEQLQIVTSQLPKAVCSERDNSLALIDAKSAVLVFPVGHINSPASMFGHTLLRIDGSSKSSLISHAVNYSADNTDLNGLAYAFKGLTGMYKGYFSLMPYYDKVREYNDLEHRDMWEYRLNLTEPEVKRMLEHIWELHKIGSSYYFLDENCSYNLLFLIEVARPELRLTDMAGIFVVPSDTVRSVIGSGVIEEVKYRPSQGTKIRKMLSLLDSDSQKIAYNITIQKSEPTHVKNLSIPIVEKIKILDIASGFLQIRYSRKDIEKDDYSRRYLTVLRERSALGAAPDDLYQIPEPGRPEQGHGSTRVSVATGVRRSSVFGELGIRPQFHALLDPDQGYLAGSQIKFFDTAVRYDTKSDEFYLKTLHILDIFSVAPRDIFFKPVSWKVNTGFDREMLHDGQEHLIYRLNTGGGFAYSSVFGGTWYVLGEIDVNIGPEFRTLVAAAPGVTIGAIEEFSTGTKCLLGIATFWYGLGDDRTVIKATAGVNQRISQNVSLSLEASREYVNRSRTSEISLRGNFYF